VEGVARVANGAVCDNKRQGESPPPLAGQGWGVVPVPLLAGAARGATSITPLLGTSLALLARHERPLLYW